MIRMIIADDELAVRNGLKQIIDWKSLGVEVIADAIDGQEALDLCNELQPDILFTDIRMPMMDGLEVAHKLKEQGSNIKIIIISGVQDFNYARTALSLNAVGYILKPVKIPELEEVVKKVVNMINLENNSEERISILKEQLHTNLPAMREKFLRTLISDSFQDEADVWSKISYFNLPFKKDHYFAAAVMKIDDFDNAVQSFVEENKQLLTFAVSNITEELADNSNYSTCFTMKENEFVLIFYSDKLTNGKYTNLCDEIIMCLNKFLKVSVSFGIGSATNSILALNFSYREALAALRHTFYTGENSVIHINDVKLNTDGINYPDLYKDEGRLMNCLRLGDGMEAIHIIDRIFKYLGASRHLPVDYVQSVCIELISIAARNIHEMGENLDHIADSRSGILDNIHLISSLTELKEYLTGIFIKITDYFSKKYNQKNIKNIQKIKEVIDSQYMKNLGVIDIAGEVYLSPNYISMVFKQETGESITEYLTKVRIEKAKQLLRSTDCKILEISELVGYENPNYFSTVFKKYTGVYPQKYRS